VPERACSEAISSRSCRPARMLVGRCARGTAGRPCTRAEAARAALGEARVVAISAPQIGPAGGGVWGWRVAGSWPASLVSSPPTDATAAQPAHGTYHTDWCRVGGTYIIVETTAARTRASPAAARGHDGEGVSGGSMSRQPRPPTTLRAAPPRPVRTMYASAGSERRWALVCGHATAAS